jgi:hypothetical protein
LKVHHLFHVLIRTDNLFSLFNMGLKRVKDHGEIEVAPGVPFCFTQANTITLKYAIPYYVDSIETAQGVLVKNK